MKKPKHFLNKLEDYAGDGAVLPNKNKKGKQHYEWLKTRKRYLNANPPNHAGYYICSLCRRWIHATEITVDHIIPRSRAQHLRHDFSNLQFACSPCNTTKGSRVIELLPEPAPEIDELEGLY